MLDTATKQAKPEIRGPQTARVAARDDDDGFDLQGTLTEDQGRVEKPGFYEAPENSKDYDCRQAALGRDASCSGELVEREAYS